MSNAYLETAIIKELAKQGASLGTARQAAAAAVAEGQHYHGKDKFGHCFQLAGKRAEMSEPGLRITRPK